MPYLKPQAIIINSHPKIFELEPSTTVGGNFIHQTDNHFFNV